MYHAIDLGAKPLTHLTCRGEVALRKLCLNLFDLYLSFKVLSFGLQCFILIINLCLHSTPNRFFPTSIASLCCIIHMCTKILVCL